jgi:nicotinate-nucleotide adenylyltransferase
MILGVYGGSFDPPHLGHRKVAVAALKKVTRLLVIPAWQSPHKADAPIAGDHRVAMLNCLLRDLPGITVDCRELRRATRSYTALTLEELRAEYPGWRLALVIGGDQLSDLPNWWQFPVWKGSVTFLVAAREDVAPSDFADTFGITLTPLDCAVDTIRSRTIREHCAAGLPVDAFTGPAVAEYLRENNLYRSTAV